MSDSEYDSVVSQPKNKSTAAGTSKRKTTSTSTIENQRATKKKITGSSSKQFDIFGILEEAENIAHKSAPTNFPVSSSFISRVSNGSVRKTAENEGEFYVELKVYKTIDAKSAKTEERWKKSLFGLKLLTEQESVQWQALQKFIREAHSVFNDSEGVFYSDKINI